MANAEHDERRRMARTKIAQTIRVLCYGRVLAEGTPAEIRGNPEVIAAYLGTSQDTRYS